MQAIATAAHAAVTAVGARPIVSEDVTTPWMGAHLKNDVADVDQFNLMTYGHNCASFASDVDRTATQGIPKAKMVLGIDLIDRTPQHTYQTLGSTSGALTTASATSSLPVSPLAAAIPAGTIVLATSENPPAHYQLFTTTGAAAGATSIPVTGATANYAYPAGSQLQSDYAGPWDCGNIANYASQQGLAGVMVWDIHEDAVLHNGSFPCFGQIAPTPPRLASQCDSRRSRPADVHRKEPLQRRTDFSRCELIPALLTPAASLLLDRVTLSGAQTRHRCKRKLRFTERQRHSLRLKARHASGSRLAPVSGSLLR